MSDITGPLVVSTDNLTDIYQSAFGRLSERSDEAVNNIFINNIMINIKEVYARKIKKVYNLMMRVHAAGTYAFALCVSHVDISAEKFHVQLINSKDTGRTQKC